MSHDVRNMHPTRKEVFYGLENGDIGQLFLDSVSHHCGTTLKNDGNRGAVTQLFSAFDMTQNGLNEIAVGRNDGSFELYDMDSHGQLQLVRFVPSVCFRNRPDCFGCTCGAVHAEQCCQHGNQGASHMHLCHCSRAALFHAEFSACVFRCGRPTSSKASRPSVEAL